MVNVIHARSLVEGTAEGPLIRLETPLGFWGGLDIATGTIIDRSHPACGMSIRGRILVMPSGRGSSSASSVLAETIRLGTAPLGIILSEADSIIAVGAIVAGKLYGRMCPIVVCRPADLQNLHNSATVRIIAGPDDAIVTVASTEDPTSAP